ncbi:hypothetical protein V2J09_012239 [Rumex salicifolius]
MEWKHELALLFKIKLQPSFFNRNKEEIRKAIIRANNAIASIKVQKLSSGGPSTTSTDAPKGVVKEVMKGRVKLKKRSLPPAFKNDEYEVWKAAGTMDLLTSNRVAFPGLAGLAWFGGPKLTWLRQKASSRQARLARHPSRSRYSKVSFDSCYSPSLPLPVDNFVPQLKAPVRENHSLPRRLDNDSMLAEREAHSINTNRENRQLCTPADRFRGSARLGADLRDWLIQSWLNREPKMITHHFTTSFLSTSSSNKYLIKAWSSTTAFHP